MREVLDRIRAGQRVSKSEVDAAIERISILIEDALSSNRPTAAKRLSETRNTLANYRQIYQKRKKSDIIKGIADASEMVGNLEASRNYEAAAKYRRLRDELQAELDAALNGKPHRPPADASSGRPITDGTQEGMRI